MREAGVLLHISSLPSEHGIGTFGRCAYEFVDFLAAAGQRYWQILPLGPTGFGDSPYQSFSTFAINPYFIDPELLKGLVTKKAIASLPNGKSPDKVDYEQIYKTRTAFLRSAYENCDKKLVDAFGEQRPRLVDYALYMAVKKQFGDRPWQEWEQGIMLRLPDALDKYRAQLEQDISFWLFTQMLAEDQWTRLKKYANKKGVKIIGDIPIYAAADSADTWTDRQVFLLDSNGLPQKKAGCPPDAFSKTGQLWGNPLYRWDNPATFDWWTDRIAMQSELYDLTRIDHFRGFDSYWAVPGEDTTAENGKWLKGPGMKLFEHVESKLGKVPLIAEDLGLMTKSVEQLLRLSGYPGMKVLQFAFDPKVDSEHLPHNHKENCVVYTGTHDNDTAVGWSKSLSGQQRKKAKAYLRLSKKEGYNWGLIRGAYQSTGSIAIVPMQDFLGLDSRARMNTPSTMSGNWQWRMKPSAATRGLAKKMRRLAKLCGRFERG